MDIPTAAAVEFIDAKEHCRGIVGGGGSIGVGATDCVVALQVADAGDRGIGPIDGCHKCAGGDAETADILGKHDSYSTTGFGTGTADDRRSGGGPLRPAKPSRPR